jgi:hypothetical protein
MTLEQLALVACGVLMNGLTFALGVAVGISLKRKDIANDNRDSQQAQAGQTNWHQPLDQQPQGCTRCRQGGCSNPQPEASAHERAHGKRVSDR